MGFRDKPTVDILLLMIAGTICGMVVAGGVTAAVVAIFTDKDAGKLVVILSDTLNTLIGLLAGFLAGRTNLTQEQKKQKEEP